MTFALFILLALFMGLGLRLIYYAHEDFITGDSDEDEA
jgi:hypothetical protein